MVRPLINKARVDRWMTCARADMERANKTEIRCPCRDCKLMYLIRHDSGMLESHLLRFSFMDGYTRWIRDDEYDDEDVNNGEDQDAMMITKIKTPITITKIGVVALDMDT